jgi:MFS family permease
MILTRTILLLGLVSLFTDMASEMLYPVMPLYLEQIGFSVAGIGILEGIAQAVAGLSKGYFGKWSDASMRRAPFVQWGYLLSAVSKPMMALWSAPLWVLGARSLDRVGKGIRTGARDALLSAEATSETKARVFGFHRSLDTLGAAIGPLLALLFLWQYPEQYRVLFFLAFVPGLIAVACTLWVKDVAPATASTKQWPGLLAFLRYLPQSPAAYRRLLTGLLAFALINSSDLFLLLLLKSRCLDDMTLIGVYIFYNLVYALAAYPAGALADRWGLKKTFVVGLLLFAAVYIGMAFAHTTWLFAGLFLGYGLYAAATEGIAKAWISNISAPTDTATAIGSYEALQSVATLLASAGAGAIWYVWGPEVLFLGTGACTIALAGYFLWGMRN